MTVAAVRSHSRRALTWPAVALLGVILLTQPWHGAINPAGLGFAGLAAIGWAAYILLTQRVGDRFTGIGGLSLTVPIAAVTAAVVGIPQATGHLTLGVLAATAGLAHPAPGPALRVRAARAAPHDSHRVRDPHGPRTRHRGAPRAARAAPEPLACPARRHPARRPCRRRRSTRWTPPKGRRPGRGPLRARPHRLTRTAPSRRETAAPAGLNQTSAPTATVKPARVQRDQGQRPAPGPCRLRPGPATIGRRVVGRSAG